MLCLGKTENEKLCIDQYNCQCVDWICLATNDILPGCYFLLRTYLC